MNVVLRVLRAWLGPLLLVGTAVGLQMLVHGRVPPPWSALLISLGVLLVYLAHNRWIERRVPVELAPRTLPALVAGVLLGCALLSATMAALSLIGAYHLTGWSSKGVAVARGAGLALSAGVFEELLFRGYLFRWFATWRRLRSAGPWVAIAATSLFFGLAHLANPHATAFSSIAIALEAGVLLGAAYWVSGNLWFPIGIHAGWNFTEGTLFDVPVSGGYSPGLILGTFHGPDWITGGAFGVEASPAAIVVCLAAAVAMLVLAVRRYAVPVR